MTILGAIFAGGKASRFGSDKAAAVIDGKPMIAHVAERLSVQCDALIVVGRVWPGLTAVSDAPGPGLGPLGALAGALRHATANGHELVLTSGCDLPDLPRDLAARLAPAPAIVAGQPLLGLWTAEICEQLIDYLAKGGDLAMRSWIEHCGARAVAFDADLANINTPEELDRFSCSVDRRSSP